MIEPEDVHFITAMQWVPADQGGRANTTPLRANYLPVMAFVPSGISTTEAAHMNNPLENHFTAKVRFLSELERGELWEGRLLAPESARRFLVQGAQVLWLEGPTITAEGVITEVLLA